MKRIILSAVVLSAICLFAVTSGDAQRGGGGGRGGGRGGATRGGAQPEMMAQMQALRVLPIDLQWAALSFACELSDSQLVTLRPIIADVYAKRSGVLKAAKKNKSWDAARDVLDDLKDDLDDQLKVLLTKDQRKKLKKAVKDNDFQPRTR